MPKFVISNLRPPATPGGKVFAICDAALGDRLVVRGVRVIDGERGRFVGMPSRKTPTGEYEAVVELAADLHAQLAADVAEAVASWQPKMTPADDGMPF